MVMKNKGIEEFKTALRTEDLKVTPQRLTVFEEVCSNKEHRNAEDIFIALQNRGKNVSRATVYRTVELLLKYELVTRLDTGDGKWKYEHWLDCSHHDHLICIRCGKIIEFIDEKIEDRQEKICNHHGYKLVRHIHQLFGLCGECYN